MAARVSRIVWWVVGVCAVTTLLLLLLLWPSGERNDVDDLIGSTAEPVSARVVDRVVAPCPFDPLLSCVTYEVIPSDGEFSGERLTLEQPLGSTIQDGDRILLLIDRLPDGAVSVSFYDFERSTSLLLLALLFVAVILVFGGWRGLGALAGLAASLFVIIVFALPALLDGANAVLIALVTASAIAFVALFLAHGFNVATAVALISTLAALVLTGLLALVFVWSANFTGFTDESVAYLDVLGASIDARGLLLAGILIGSLGVLDDVTVTQVSAVLELKHAAPEADAAELYRRGVRIGRDHISSTVNTLFLAYVGAALPLMLLFRQAGQSIGSVATQEIVAVEIVRALVGSIGLVAAVPIATFLASHVATLRQDGDTAWPAPSVDPPAE